MNITAIFTSFLPHAAELRIALSNGPTRGLHGVYDLCDTSVKTVELKSVERKTQCMTVKLVAPKAKHKAAPLTQTHVRTYGTWLMKVVNTVQDGERSERI